jgi:hypothetical protein
VSRIYDALKRAEREHRRTQVVGPPVDGHTGLGTAWDVDDDARLEYERLQVWITNSAPDSPPNRAIMVVSCQHANGATTTAAGLAVTLAQRPTARPACIGCSAPVSRRASGSGSTTETARATTCSPPGNPTCS